VNILVLAPNWLGDAVMALPAIADVRRHFPGATVTVAARRPLAALAAMVPGVDHTLALESGRGARMLATIPADARRLRAGCFDAVLLLPNSFHAALVAFGARIPERWGYRADFRAPLLTRAVPRPRAPRMHQAEYYQHLTSALGIPAGPLRAEIRVDARHRADADRLLRAHGWDGGPLVGIAPGAAYGSAKRWLPDRMGAVAARLARDGHAGVVVVGADEDRETVEIVTRTATAEGARSSRVLNLAGKTDLPVLAGVLSRCRAFVSNDSGAMHLAAAVDVPVVAIFGPTREWATSPLPGPSRLETAIVRTDVPCRPCMLRTCPIDHRCMTRIAVDDVMAPVMVALQRTPTTREAP
jgi:lipopolysaccharide heptosyltransferase II